MPERSKPTITFPNGAPPSDLVIDILEEGEGVQATAGSTVSVHYVGSAWSTKSEFDSSWDRNEPFDVVLGKGQVIPGWDRGLVGMREGERRQLTIPPHLAYGAAGAGLFIRPNETLVFVVDLLSVS
jgi:peptidylprolyl isomerase